MKTSRMKLAADSLEYLHGQIDSLNKVAENHKVTLKLNEVSVQTALIAATTALTTLFLGFLIKDYLIPLIVENRVKRKKGQELFIKSKRNLFSSANSFNHRLKEIFQTRSHYLWQQTPLIGFYDYKYRSTVFRLCTLLGWIRIYRIQEPNIVIKKKAKTSHQIIERIRAIESSLADGQRVEMYVVKAIFQHVSKDTNAVPQVDLENFAVEIDHLVHATCSMKNILRLNQGDNATKDNFIEDLSKLAQPVNIALTELQTVKDKIVDEVSVKLGLIYRDWQDAIGDLMLLKNGEEYQTISYKTFETYWDQANTTLEKKWLKRAEVMFDNLNLTANTKSDSRIEQIPLIYSSIYELQKTLYDIKIGSDPISKANFEKISATIK
ncbi:hypothetical protein [Sphingobacterium paludis]|uniref:Uncharacterized protein n=1 Tax=Sphingobacterium paludis TaxID=1476465 RepID=A0A4R7CVD8_9SPHI|nr:hypothetical protein [Sphingobacterium paludis]TDS11817.1 hypothetical protein B0I21_107167 [Sphingobacterium paludis]